MFTGIALRVPDPKKAPKIMMIGEFNQEVVTTKGNKK